MAQTKKQTEPVKDQQTVKVEVSKQLIEAMQDPSVLPQATGTFELNGYGDEPPRTVIDGKSIVDSGMLRFVLERMQDVDKHLAQRD